VAGLELGKKCAITHSNSRCLPFHLLIKTSPKERNLVKKHFKVGKITSLKRSPKETNLVKKTARLGKITSMEKISPNENNLVKNSIARTRETWCRLVSSLFLLFLFKKN
jgi:hypothetical protein